MYIVHKNVVVLLWFKKLEVGLKAIYGQKERTSRSSFLQSTLRVKTKHLLNDNWEDNTNLLSTAAVF